MSGNESQSSLQERFIRHIEVLTLWWADCLSSLQHHFFADEVAYSPRQQVDLILTAIAMGVSRWSQCPQAQIAQIKRHSRRHDLPDCRPVHTRDMKVDALLERMALRVHRAVKQSTATSRVEGDMAAMIVPIQLGAVQCAAAEVFSVLYPATTVLETLRLMFLEELPVQFIWCA